MTTFKAFGNKFVTKAPKGGFDHPVNGKRYRGGQFCPMFAVAGGSDETQVVATPEGTIRFVEHAKYGSPEHRWTIEQARQLDDRDPIEWTIACYCCSGATKGQWVRLQDRGCWPTRKMALLNLEHQFAGYGKTHKVERIG